MNKVQKVKLDLSSILFKRLKAEVQCSTWFLVCRLHKTNLNQFQSQGQWKHVPRLMDPKHMHQEFFSNCLTLFHFWYELICISTNWALLQYLRLLLHCSEEVSCIYFEAPGLLGFFSAQKSKGWWKSLMNKFWTICASPRHSEIPAWMINLGNWKGVYGAL